MMTRQEIVYELVAARKLLELDPSSEADKIVKRVLEQVALDAIDDPRGRQFK